MMSLYPENTRSNSFSSPWPIAATAATAGKLYYSSLKAVLQQLSMMSMYPENTRSNSFSSPRPIAATAAAAGKLLYSSWKKLFKSSWKAVLQQLESCTVCTAQRNICTVRQQLEICTASAWKSVPLSVLKQLES